MTRTRFDQYSLKLFLVYLGLVSAAFLLLAEYFLKEYMGLGNPVIYDSNPLYGYRPVANQDLVRFHGSRLYFNNLGLRAEHDWDADPKKKILFLGDSVTYGGSYVGNQDLFSTLAVANLPGYTSGNAGVNGWGVDNIYGLVVESGFLPAEVYVTVLIEDDFYRGLTRIHGSHFWLHKPRFALQELVYFAVTRLNDTKFENWKATASVELRESVVEKAVLKLKRLDDFFKSRGYSHLICIAPTKKQVQDEENVAPIVLAQLKRHEVPAVYLLDSLRDLHVDAETSAAWFHDDVHLEKEGHAMWARLLADVLISLANDTENKKG